MIYVFILLLAFFFFFLATVVLFTGYYLMTVLQVTSFSQIVYNLKFGMEGTSKEVWTGAIFAFFRDNWLVLLIAFLVCVVLAVWLIRRRAHLKRLNPKENKIVRKRLRRGLNLSLALCLVSGVFFFGSSIYVLESLGYFSYLFNARSDSGFYEEFYTQPDVSLLTFPEQKKNLIILWLESMETSLASEESGGNSDTSRIPFLEKLAIENTNFATEGQVGGAYMTTNTSMTISGMIAESAGIPLCYHGEGIISEWSEEQQFLPGAVSLGDLLEAEGYTNKLRVGSTGSYSGRANYFQQHGDFTIEDYQSSIDAGLIEPGYFVFWGYEDKKLFEFAKQDLDEISNDQPFCYALLTVDSHFPGGYLDEEASTEFDDQIDNVFANTDKQVEAFLSWCSQQSWYKDTVIMIAGDHLSMDETVATRNDDYTRKVYFTLLNAPASIDEAREFMTMDIFPTLVAALGVEIEGEHLGLGTNLYSGEPTLIEQIGLQQLNNELVMTSDYYTKEIMGLDEEELP